MDAVYRTDTRLLRAVNAKEVFGKISNSIRGSQFHRKAIKIRA
jgi:hypothetical protein